MVEEFIAKYGQKRAKSKRETAKPIRAPKSGLKRAARRSA